MKIAIIGGGCSGVLTTAQLFRLKADVDVVMVEPGERLGHGLAYSTPWREHLLNVPAQNMSAFPCEPSHFVDWLKVKMIGGASDQAFAPRQLYGDYMDEVLRSAIKTAGGQKRFRHARAEVTDVAADERGITFTLNDGSRLPADRVVIALGNQAAQSIPGRVDADALRRCYPSAWEENALRVESKEERVLVIGSGLTAIDAVLALEGQRHRGRIDMVSRRGLLPQAHRAGLAGKIAPVVSATTGLRAMCRQLRQQIEILAADGTDWRVAVDSLRPVTNEWWQNLEMGERRRFVRHLKPYWDIHRHRMAPEIDEAINRCRSEGRLNTHAGRLLEIKATRDALTARIALRRGGELNLAVDRVINCTGIEERFHKSSRPLIRALIGKGLARVNEMGVGFSTDADGAMIDAAGKTSTRIFAIGPMRNGSLLETTAVPEIRVQAEVIAQRLARST